MTRRQNPHPAAPQRICPDLLDEGYKGLKVGQLVTMSGDAIGSHASSASFLRVIGFRPTPSGICSGLPARSLRAKDPGCTH
jgi:hypothetical protein